jgi:hypothetical protein
MPQYTVEPAGNQWRVKKYGNFVSRHNKKSRAVEKAKKLARKKNGKVTIKRSDGTYQDTNSYE